MAIFPTGNLFPGLGGGFRIPGVAMRASVKNFFDRDAVKNALSEMEHRALSKGSMRIKDYAKRSIRKMGMAKPKLKIMRQNPNMNLRQAAAVPGLATRTRRAIETRAREIKTRPPSSPGTPPHTHVPYGHMLGFRRNLWNFYDPISHSAVVGPSQKGRMLPYLHEFGGTQMLATWQYVPQYPRKYNPIFWRLSVGQKPRNTGKWVDAGHTSRATYPARPFMQPAMRRAIARGDLAKPFGGQFKAAIGPRAGFGNL